MNGTHPELCDELLAMVARDTQTRTRLAATGELFEGYHPEMEAVHRRNAARLREILEEHGWPGTTLVGVDGAEAAWLIVQHAIGEPDLMRACVPMLIEAAALGESDPVLVAYLEDRVRVYEGRPQRYGTQYDWDDAGRFMVPMVGIEDPERVDERRAAVGLEPLQWRRDPPADEPPPADLAARRAQMHAWAVRTGWRRS